VRSIEIHRKIRETFQVVVLSYQSGQNDRRHFTSPIEKVALISIRFFPQYSPALLKPGTG